MNALLDMPEIAAKPRRRRAPSERRGYDSTTAFIYALSDPRTPHDYRYIGRTTLGVEDRAKGHIQVALSRLPDGAWRNAVTHKIAWIRAMARDGYRPVVTALAEVPREARIFAEQQWIAAMREAGYRLTNATAGGEGPELYKATDQTRERQSAANRRRFENNPVEREFYRRQMLALYAGEEGRRRLADQTRAQWARPGAREAQSERIKLVLASSPELIARRAASLKTLLATERGQEIRAANAKRFRGEGNPCSRLTWDQVCQIRERYQPGAVTQRELAAEFGVTQGLIGQVIRCMIWNVDPETGEPIKIPSDLPKRAVSRAQATDENLKEAAQIYRAAVVAGKPTAPAIAARFDISLVVAYDWVRKARKRGIMGPTRPGFIGEGDAATSAWIVRTTRRGPGR